MIIWLLHIYLMVFISECFYHTEYCFKAIILFSLSYLIIYWFYILMFIPHWIFLNLEYCFLLVIYSYVWYDHDYLNHFNRFSRRGIDYTTKRNWYIFLKNNSLVGALLQLQIKFCLPPPHCWYQVYTEVTSLKFSE